jgi:outer membrane protein insertion porin family
MGRAELEIPLGSGAKELGLRPSIFMDVGAVWGVRTPHLDTIPTEKFIPTKDSSGTPQYTLVCNGTATVVSSNNGTPTLPDNCTTAGDGVTAIGTTVAPFKEFFVGNTWKPRLAIGFGVNWNSPFGPFRIDVAKVLLKQDGDDTKTFTFNVGTQF